MRWTRYLRRGAPGPARLSPPRRLAKLRRLLAAPRKWDEVEAGLLHFIVPEGRAAIDVGANTGAYAVRLGLLCDRVVAVEPWPEACRILRAAAMPNVEVVDCALSDRAGRATLRAPLDEAGAEEVALASLEPADGPARALEVETRRLDEFAAEDVGFLKIDVEGHEMAVLRGGAALIAARRPVALVEAEDRHRPGAVAACRGFFEAQGYVGYFIFRGRTHALSALTPEMTDPAALTADRPRRDMAYVNNFIFAPDEDTARRQRREIDRALALRRRLFGFGRAR